MTQNRAYRTVDRISVPKDRIFSIEDQLCKEFAAVSGSAVYTVRVLGNNHFHSAFTRSANSKVYRVHFCHKNHSIFVFEEGILIHSEEPSADSKHICSFVILSFCITIFLNISNGKVFYAKT